MLDFPSQEFTFYLIHSDNTLYEAIEIVPLYEKVKYRTVQNVKSFKLLYTRCNYVDRVSGKQDANRKHCNNLFDIILCAAMHYLIKTETRMFGHMPLCTNSVNVKRHT